jgi:hypothetical protein
MSSALHKDDNEANIGSSNDGGGGGCTVERHLSRKTGTPNRSDVQKIRIIIFFFESTLHWQS